MRPARLLERVHVRRHLPGSGAPSSQLLRGPERCPDCEFRPSPQGGVRHRHAQLRRANQPGRATRRARRAPSGPGRQRWSRSLPWRLAHAFCEVNTTTCTEPKHCSTSDHCHAENSRFMCRIVPGEFVAISSQGSSRLTPLHRRLPRGPQVRSRPPPAPRCNGSCTSASSPASDRFAGPSGRLAGWRRDRPSGHSAQLGKRRVGEGVSAVSVARPRLPLLRVAARDHVSSSATARPRGIRRGVVESLARTGVDQSE